MPGSSSFSLLFLLLCACQHQGPKNYEMVLLDKVCERDEKGIFLHPDVQVEGFLEMPPSIWGHGTRVTLHEAPGEGKSIQLDMDVDSTGSNCIILKGNVYFNESLRLADSSGKKFKFTDKVLIKGTLGLQASGQSPDCYIRVDQVQQSQTPEDIPLYRPALKNMNEEIALYQLTYIIKKIKIQKTVGKEDGFTSTAPGLYLIAELNVRNDGDENAIFSEDFIRLKDDKGTEFPSSSDGNNALFMSGLKGLSAGELKPHEKQNRLLVFEIPRKNVYYLQLSGHYGQGKTMMVKLPEN